jgi:beta-phosphoglucomutase-like phosphatase (HAD superfamily)
LLQARAKRISFSRSARLTALTKIAKIRSLQTTHLPELFSHFPTASIVTADTEQVKRGKPHPDIFLYAAETLGVKTDEDRARTLVFEDGIPGVKAAVAAGMPGESACLSQSRTLMRFRQWFGYQTKAY